MESVSATALIDFDAMHDVSKQQQQQQEELATAPSLSSQQVENHERRPRRAAAHSSSTAVEAWVQVVMAAILECVDEPPQAMLRRELNCVAVTRLRSVAAQCTPLHYAVVALVVDAHGAPELQRRALDVIQWLVETCGVFASPTDAQGATPLHLLMSAVGSCPAICAESVLSAARMLLVAGGADANATNSVGYTPLHTLCAAASDANIDVATAAAALLLDNGADPNATSSLGHTPLHCAAAGFGTLPLVRQLVVHAGAKVGAADHHGLTSLHAAASSGADAAELVEFLLSAVESDKAVKLLDARDNNGNTPLHSATLFDRQPGVVRALLDRMQASGLDVGCRNASKATALHAICASGVDAADVVDTLVDAGIAVNAADNGGWTALHAAFACGADQPAVVRRLLARGADLNLTSFIGGFAPIHSAAAHGEGLPPGEFAALRFLVEVGGANVEHLTDDDGATPLALACSSGRTDVAEYLCLQRGANVNATTVNGTTPLMHAIAAGEDNVSIVQLLVERCGADVRACDARGCNALHWAAALGNDQVRILEYLMVRHRFDPLEPTQHGELQSALHLAASNPNGAVQCATFIMRFYKEAWWHLRNQEALDDATDRQQPPSLAPLLARNAASKTPFEVVGCGAVCRALVENVTLPFITSAAL